MALILPSSCRVLKLAIASRVDHGAVGPVPLVEVDHVDPEVAQRLLHRDPQVGHRPVAAPLLALAPGDAALGGDHDVVAVAAVGGHGLADQGLVVAHGVPGRGVDVGGVDQGDAGVQRGVDGRDGLRLVGIDLVVVHRHRHRTEADRGDCEGSELSGLHEPRPYRRPTTILPRLRPDRLPPPAAPSAEHDQQLRRQVRGHHQRRRRPALAGGSTKAPYASTRSETRKISAPSGGQPADPGGQGHHQGQARAVDRAPAISRLAGA